MKTRAVVCSGLGEPWKTEEIELDPPANREVLVKMVYAGMCHSDEHLRTGDIERVPRDPRGDRRTLHVPGHRRP